MHPLIRMIAIAAATLFAQVSVAQTYPLTVEHKFGTTVVETQPTRVATLDFVGADDLLALGVQPVVIRHWYGDYPRSVWPWADELLASEPSILRGELNFEQITAAEPDVIFALWSGITADDYEKLSMIAPVIAVPEGVGDYSMPWDERAILAGRVVGAEQAAIDAVDQIRAQLDDVAAQHPSWTGKTAAVAYQWSDVPGAYTSADIRPMVLNAMGFETPAAIDENADPSGFTTTLSPEDLSPLDGDLIVWISTDGDYSKVEQLVARPFLNAVQNEQELFLDAELSGAFSHSTLLSLPYAIDRLVPQIEAVLD